jgi:DNA repair photolyase
MSRENDGSFQVHLCFTTDPYQPIEFKEKITRRTVQILHKYGLTVAILTKAGTAIFRDLDLYGPGDAIAATMTYGTVEDSRREEPCAALPNDRYDMLKKFHAIGVPTWVSMEPVLDPLQTIYLIETVHDAVDHFKVGKLNHDPKRESQIDWVKFGRKAIATLESLGYKRIMDPDDAIHANAKNHTFYIKSGLARILELAR